MVDLMEALWEILLGNTILRWFFIGLLIGLVLVGYMIYSGTQIDAGDALMGIVVCGILCLGGRIVWWYVNQ